MTDKTQELILKIGVGAFLLIFTIGAFIINPNQSTDKYVTENLWEAVHPLKWYDIFGLIIFYASGAFLSGLKPVMNPANSSMWNYITFAGLIIGIVIILV